MRNKETGEFELVVGNGQLVSGFFIVIVLFAMGVAMGYILGQNSEKSAKGQQPEAVPCVATDGKPQAAQTIVTQQSAPPQQSAETPPAGSEPQPTTQPAKQQEPPPTPAAKPDPPKEQPKPEPPPKKEVAAPAAPAAGFYWQVASVANQEAAKAVVKTLKDRGFAAHLEPGPTNRTRVLVGPFNDTPSKAKAKTELEGMSYKPIPFHRD